MSHFSVVKTELKNVDMVRAALCRLGVSFRDSGEVEDYFHNRQAVELVVELPGQRPVGFRRSPSGIFELVGDWWGAHTTQQQFIDSLKSSYAREQVLRTLATQGVDVSRVKEIEEEDGSVVFVVPLDEEGMQALGG